MKKTKNLIIEDGVETPILGGIYKICDEYYILGRSRTPNFYNFINLSDGAAKDNILERELESYIKSYNGRLVKNDITIKINYE